MEAALQRKDYSEVLHASASVFETLAKDIVGTSNVQNQTLKSFFERYKKNSLLPQEFLDLILSLYDLRNTTPLAGHGSTQVPNVARETAIAVCEMTKAFVEIEYKLQTKDSTHSENAETDSPSSTSVKVSFAIDKDGVITTEKAELLALVSEALYAVQKQKAIVDFDIRLEFLETIKSAILSLESSSKPKDRTTKVKLLNLKDEQSSRLDLFIKAIKLAFQYSVSNYLASADEFVEIIEGLALHDFGSNDIDRNSEWHSVDIYRKSDPKLIARIRINQQETETIVSQLELGHISQLVDYGGYKLYDFPPEIRYSKGLPAILSCIIWENKKHPESFDLEKMLDFSAWHIGLA